MDHDASTMLNHPAASRDLRIPLAPHPISAEIARKVTSLMLHNWQLYDLIESAKVVVSELVTNALKLNEVFNLGLFRHGDYIMIEVTDRNLGTPKVRKPGEDAEDGRGLLLVECMAEEWNIRYEEDGAKTVWALVAK